VGGNRNCRRDSCRRCRRPRPRIQPETKRHRIAGNKNKGLAGTKPLAPNPISKTSVQTTTSSKRQFALILPSPSTSSISRQSALQRDCNPDRHPSNSAVNRATPMRYQSIIASVNRSAAMHHDGARSSLSAQRIKRALHGADSYGDVARRCTATDQNSGLGFVRATTRNRIDDAVAVLSGSRRLALGSSRYRFLAAKNLPKADTPLSMRALTSIIPRSEETIDIGTAGPLRRSLGGADSGRRTLSMTRSLGERAVTTVEDH